MKIVDEALPIIKELMPNATPNQVKLLKEPNILLRHVILVNNPKVTNKTKNAQERIVTTISIRTHIQRAKDIVSPNMYHGVILLNHVIYRINVTNEVHARTNMKKIIEYLLNLETFGSLIISGSTSGQRASSKQSSIHIIK